MCATQLWFSLSALINHLNVTRTRPDIAGNPFLPFPTPRTPGSFCLDICQTRAGPPCAAVCPFPFSLFCYYSPMRLHLARIISYAFLNKSARTAITIDTACPPSLSLSLSSSRSYHLFRPAPGPDTRTNITVTPGTGSWNMKTLIKRTME